MQIAIAEAKAQLAELIRRVEAGEEIELTRYGRPVARLVPPHTVPRRPLIGAMRGRVRMAADFDELPEGFAEALEAPVEPGPL